MSHNKMSRPERPLTRLRRALAVLRGTDYIDDHPDAWAYRATWWGAGERATEDRILRAQARNQ